MSQTDAARDGTSTAGEGQLSGPGTAGMVTVKQAAARLTVSPSLVYAMVATGKLPAVRLGNGRGTIRIAVADLDRLLDGAKVAPPASPALRHLSLGV